MPDETVAQKPNEPAICTHSPGELGTTRVQSDQDAKCSAEKSARLEVPGYQLLEEIGQGGMGVVWRARDLNFQRDVAVKLLQDNYAASSTLANRFLDEAKITGQLEHPGIPPVHQVGTLADGRPFLAMKLIKGDSLAALLEAKQPINVLAVFEQIAQAVGYAHAHGVIHRDLKPANVMVGAFGEVQVMDWGLAKILASGWRQPSDPSETSSPLVTEIQVNRGSDHTQAGSTLGTVAFMPPEQAIGAHDQMGPPSDVFGLGAVLCTLLTGQPPYVAESWESTRQLAALAKQSDALERLANCGAEPELIALCRHCLAPEPKDRPANGSAVAEAVAKLRAAADERARQAEVDRAKAEVQTAEQRKRRKLQLISGGIALALMLGGSSFAFWEEHRRNQILIASAAADAQRARERDAEAQRTIETNARLLTVADDKQFLAAFPQLAGQGDRGLPTLRGILELQAPAGATYDEKERLTKQRSTALIALMRLGETERIWPLLKHSNDPTLRSELVNRFDALGVEPKVLIRRLEGEPDLSSRRALILSLGQFSDAQLPAEARQTLIPGLQEIYRREPDAGLHAAAEWLLRTWKQGAWLKQVNENWAENAKSSGGSQPPVRCLRKNRTAGLTPPRSPSHSPGWHVNGQGQTMISFHGPIEFLMGSPATEPGRREDETQHRQTIPRSFAISAAHVTFDQYRKFDPSYEQQPQTKTGDCPATMLNWHEAAAYCNWLSKEEGIPETEWCYVIGRDRVVTAMKPNYLSLAGYRLPTEVEWEYAARAGAATAYSFGAQHSLLQHYGWYERNANLLLHPIGKLKPNDYGLFDVHGNAYCWCQHVYDPNIPAGCRSRPGVDSEEELAFTSSLRRVQRGGTFAFSSSSLRCSSRNTNEATAHYITCGLRLARTIN